MRKPRFTAVIALAGLAAAGSLAALALPQAANAWDWMNLPSGYVVSGASDGMCPDGSGHSRNWITVNGYQIIPSTCDAAAFQAALDAYVDSTICTVNPVAGGAACAATTTTQTTAPDPVTTTTIIEPPPPPSASTVPDVQAQIDDLKSQIAALKGRVDRLEAAADAEWLSYHDALAAGLDPIVASMVARQTGYDLIHGTGPFRP